MLGHLFNRQQRLTHHSTVTALQGCLIYPHYRSLSLQSCPDCSPWCLLVFLSFLTTFQYMMAGIHLDVQLYEKLCIFLTEVWQARSAWNVFDCLILLLLLLKKILEVFRACGGGSFHSFTQLKWKFQQAISSQGMGFFSHFSKGKLSS